jgi:hypothetical protein
MKNTISLDRREVERLHELFNLLTETENFDSVTLRQQADNGIGSVLTATFTVMHKGIEGEFTVAITDQGHW